MESCGVPGRIHISRSTYERVYDLGFEFEECLVEVKGKGKMQSYLLNSKHHKSPLPKTGNDAIQDDTKNEESVCGEYSASSSTNF